MNENCLFTLDVFLISEPWKKKSFKTKPEVSRNIQIAGTQTLETLHHAIFTAFDRFDDHLYEFSMGSFPLDRDGMRYTHSFMLEDSAFVDDPHLLKDVTETCLRNMNLEVGQTFFYLFDFGDEWWHGIKVLSIEEKPKGKRFPKIVSAIGKSPPQYPDFGDEEETEA